MKRTSLLKYPGGKSYLADRILRALPRGPWTRYVEPFLGGGAVMLAGAGRGMERIGCDVYQELITLWQELSNAQFQVMVRDLTYTQETFDAVLAWEPPLSSAELAVQTLVRHRFSRGGDGRSFAWSTRLRGGKPGDVNAWEGFVRELSGIARSVQDVSFENWDVLESIRRYDSPTTLWYMDPPYVHETRVSTNLYRHEMTLEQHKNLVECLRTIKGGCVVSGYRHPLYESLGWRSIAFDMPCNQAQTAVKSRREEVLWINRKD